MMIPRILRTLTLATLFLGSLFAGKADPDISKTFRESLAVLERDLETMTSLLRGLERGQTPRLEGIEKLLDDSYGASAVSLAAILTMQEEGSPAAGKALLRWVTDYTKLLRSLETIYGKLAAHYPGNREEVIKSLFPRRTQLYQLGIRGYPILDRRLKELFSNIASEKTGESEGEDRDPARRMARLLFRFEENRRITDLILLIGNSMVPPLLIAAGEVRILSDNEGKIDPYLGVLKSTVENRKFDEKKSGLSPKTVCLDALYGTLSGKELPSAAGERCRKALGKSADAFPGNIYLEAIRRGGERDNTKKQGASS